MVVFTANAELPAVFGAVGMQGGLVDAHGLLIQLQGIGDATEGFEQM